MMRFRARTTPSPTRRRRRQRMNFQRVDRHDDVDAAHRRRADDEHTVEPYPHPDIGDRMRVIPVRSGLIGAEPVDELLSE